MEEIKEKQIEKKFINKKILGIPVLFIILGIGLVLAVGTYYYFFMQTIQVHGIINHPIQENPIIIPLVILGNLHPVLNCTVGLNCSTEEISISNPSNYEQVVNVMVSMPLSVDAINFTPDLTTINQTFATMTLSSGGTKSFYVIYHLLDNTTDTEFDSDITIVSNMTQ